MGYLDRRVSGHTLLIAVALLGFGTPGCERGGGEAPESEAEAPADESSGAVSDDETSDENEGAAAAESDEREKPAGDPLPDLTARNLDGEVVTLEATGEATLVNLWATWCAPCIAELPEFRTLRETWSDRGLRLIGISIEGAEAEQKVAEFVDEREVPFDQVLYAAERDPLDAFGGGSVPASFLYDADGTLVWWHGSMLKEPDVEQLESALSEVLGSAPK